MLKDRSLLLSEQVYSPAYEANMSSSGTGFLVDKSKGIILTNQHVIGTAVVGTYEVSFYNGIREQAKIIYYDPWLDYGFLKVDPSIIPADVQETSISPNDPMPNQSIFIIGNNQGKSFSIHTGVVASTYHIDGGLPQHSVHLNLNTTGGSSGSPIFNTKGEAIALNYAGDGTIAIALHPSYIRYALHAIKKGAYPVRKHIGVLCTTRSLVDSTRYNGFPLAMQQAYAKKFPDACSQAIAVSTVLPNTPAAKQLLPGDIIWAINKKERGPNLYALDMAMNKGNQSIDITIFRNGNWQDVTIELDDIEAHKIAKLVQFGGVCFFEADDYFGQTGGIPTKSLTFAYGDSNHIFTNINSMWHDFYRLRIIAIDNKPLHTLEDLIKIIPTLIQKKYSTIEYAQTMVKKLLVTLIQIYV